MAGALQGGALQQGLLGVEGFPLIRPQDGTRSDGVDANLRAEVTGQCLGHHHQCGLGHAVDGMLGQWAFGVHVDQIDDAALLRAQRGCSRL